VGGWVHTRSGEQVIKTAFDVKQTDHTSKVLSLVEE
jgi:hypothetical protein